MFSVLIVVHTFHITSCYLPCNLSIFLPPSLLGLACIHFILRSIVLASYERDGSQR
jgi:hypothetical protein